VRRATWGHVDLSASFPVGPDQAVAVGAPIVLRSGVSGKRGALFLLAIRVTLELRVLAVDLLLVTGGIERVTVLGRRGFLSGFLGWLLGRLLRCGLLGGLLGWLLRRLRCGQVALVLADELRRRELLDLLALHRGRHVLAPHVRGGCATEDLHVTFAVDL